jgi:phosphotransferase system enzyme I (PtsP)
MLGNLLSILRQISETIAKTGDHLEALQKIVSILAKSLNVDVCSVYEYDEANDRLVLTATCGLDQNAIMNVSMKPGEGLTGISFKERKILNLANPQSHPGFRLFENIGEEQYRSFLSVPLTISGKCLGILTIQRKEEKKFDQPVADMVRSISTQLANLFLNSILLKGIQKTSIIKKQQDRTGQLMLPGVATTAGVTLGNAFLFSKEDLIKKFSTPAFHGNLDEELLLFENALKLAKEKTLELENKALTLISEADASIFNVHLMFLEDQAVLGEVKTAIKKHGFSVEYAIASVYNEYEKKFLQINDQTFRDRSFDLKDVMIRIIESVTIIKDAVSVEEAFNSDSSKLILVAKELLPSDLIRMPVDNFVGIICEKGGATAHVSILAKALNIPAILGVKGVTQHTINNDEILMDGHSGKVYIRPGEQVKKHFQDQITPDTEEENIIMDMKPTVTLDGVNVRLRANISLICEASNLEQYGAHGIGLYRTEFMYMVRDHLPAEEDQYNVFRQVLNKTSEEVTIRVLDVGGDKPLPYVDLPQEDNPALGYRGIRLLLKRTNLFKTHLRAILRAGAKGKLKLLLPMVSTLQEILKVKEILAEVEQELHENNIPHSENYKIGIMIEIPSILFMLDSLIPHLDFMSIGTNDLLQYCFAVDRANEQVGGNADALDPAFIRIIKHIGDFFAAHPDKELTLCGEMANIIQAVPLLVGAGIKELSMPPKFIPGIAKVVRQINAAECRVLLKKASSMKTSEEVKREVNRFLLAANRPM